MFGFSKKELDTLKKLNSPIKIQDFIDTLEINFEENGETLMSPRRVLGEKKAHCIEGALLAASALWLHGKKPLLLDLKADHSDDDHVVALYRIGDCFGAISKSNHAVLRFRDPIYRSTRELALSYFHEYVNDKGEKTLTSHSRPFDLRRYGTGWLTSTDNQWEIAADLDDSPHYRLYGRAQKKHIRDADTMEHRAGDLLEWEKPEVEKSRRRTKRAV